MKTITLEQASDLLCHANALFIEGCVTTEMRFVPSAQEGESWLWITWRDGDGEENSTGFRREDNKTVVIIGPFIYLKDRDGDRLQMVILKEIPDLEALIQ